MGHKFPNRDLEFQSRDLEFQSRDLEFQSRDLEFQDYYGMAQIELRSLQCLTIYYIHLDPGNLEPYQKHIGAIKDMHHPYTNCDVQ